MCATGIIAIGRNEGERLRRCLTSALNRGRPVVYVDSASTDGSAELAASMGAEVVNLDMSIPFSAARARNEGMDRLLQIAPDVQFVMMVDGDCEIVDGFIEKAEAELLAKPQAAVVCGRRRERFPEASIYNRIADIEWNSPVGEARSCGGDALFRVSAFREAGGYDNSVVAGEEPELCQRLREKGWKVYRIDAEMTIHDSAMFHFAQWWKRSVRSGYGAMDVATRFAKGPEPLFLKQVKSARAWAVGWPIAFVASLFFSVGTSVLIAALGGSVWLSALCSLAVLVVGLLPLLQILRIARGSLRRAGNLRAALIYGTLTLIGKWANFAGQRQYQRDRRAGKLTRLIDYKAAGGR
jgi:cellulose synthase/poly-beta-1,6-N-acetylglucosamine synthase-like glycosyltransferase